MGCASNAPESANALHRQLRLAVQAIISWRFYTSGLIAIDTQPLESFISVIFRHMRELNPSFSV